MPGQEQPGGPRAGRGFGACLTARDESGDVPPSRSLASRTNRPAVAALIATLAAVAFTLVRWQTWAHGHISRFILVGRHFATPSQLPHGMPVAKTYGYDGQFFYRLALNPLNFHHTAYGITMDRPYRYMRIGYPALTWLISAGQHSLVPVMLVAINIAAIGALGYLGALFAAQGGRHAPGRAADPRVLRPPHQPVPGHRGAARRRLPAGRAARGPEPPSGAGRRAARLRGADQGDGHGGRGRHRHHAGDRHAPRPGHGQARPRGPGLGGTGGGLRGLAGRGEGRDRERPAARRRRPERRALRSSPRSRRSGTTSPTSTCTSSSSTTCGSWNWPSSSASRSRRCSACAPRARRGTSGWRSSSTWWRSASSRRAPGTAWTPTCARSSRCTCWP